MGFPSVGTRGRLPLWTGVSAGWRLPLAHAAVRCFTGSVVDVVSVAGAGTTSFPSVSAGWPDSSTVIIPGCSHCTYHVRFQTLKVLPWGFFMTMTHLSYRLSAGRLSSNLLSSRSRVASREGTGSLWVSLRVSSLLLSNLGGSERAAVSMVLPSLRS